MGEEDNTVGPVGAEERKCPENGDDKGLLRDAFGAKKGKNLCLIKFKKK